MTHRSNQAVASQDTASQLGSPLPPRRALTAWALAFAAFMVSLVLVGLAFWLIRLPLAHFIISGALSERGVDADFQVAQLGFNEADLTAIRLGSEAAPDLNAATTHIEWRWRGLTPRITRISINEPYLRLRLNQDGAVSAGTLDRLRGEPSRQRPSIPVLDVNISSGRAAIETPAGTLNATFESQGKLGETFSARIDIAETTVAGEPGFALDGAHAHVAVASLSGGALTARINADARSLTWAGVNAKGAALRATIRTPMSLARMDVDAALAVEQFADPRASGTQFVAALRARTAMQENALAIDHWSTGLDLRAASVALPGARMLAPAFDLRGGGEGADGRITWRLVGATFEGAGLRSQQPAAAGAVRLSSGAVAGDASIALNTARLTNRATRVVRSALPSLGGAPLGPTFDRARRALEHAGQRFDLTIPLQVAGGAEGYRVWVPGAAEARAASGAKLTLSALREDAPALTLTLPDTALSGALALELSGGDAPSVALLLDTASWTPRAPLEADGTLSLSNWSAANARINADELGVSFTLANDSGRVDLNGPLLVSGPLGDGVVRDLNAALDLSILWDASGWRAIPANGACQRIRAQHIEAAGLAFNDGAFSLCPLGGALIAADTSQQLSGGFSIQRLALRGRMAGPGAQPARLAAADIEGRFHGRVGSAALHIDATAPSLAIDFGPERTLNLALRRATADARFTQSWSVSGNFEQGVLSDPNLPGAVSAIAGTWSAAPEAGKPVIRIEAGEALLTANEPVSDSERLLFNPLRMAATTATLRNGVVDAQGAIVLADGAHPLATFSAHHAVSEGAGAAIVETGPIIFSESLQPYDITERLRGLVDNVRGPVAVIAQVDWNLTTISARGRARFDGVSLATSTIPVVEDVRGEVVFDDLFQFTTPPGQVLAIGHVNPGVSARNGRVDFQLLPEQHVAIERAEFEFASGTLAMAPTTIALGAEETRFALTLRDVDAASLIASLDIPDLAVTGTIEGDFPLRLTRRSGFIENGVLRAQNGGTIAYTGNAGMGATGAAAIAFDALKSFRYDALSLTLNGDLSGEVVSSISFSGENSGRPVDLGPIAPIPGAGRVTVRGVPFDFNVTVTAPFRRLAQTVASITDPGAILNSATGGQPPQPVDPAPSPPR